MTEQKMWRGPRAGDPGLDPQLRAGDSDRDRVAENLRTQHAAGRLDTEELQSRIDVCYEAKTVGELQRLLVDLPREPPAPVRPGWLRGRRRPRLLWLVALIMTLAAISAVTGRHVIWLAIPLAFLATRVTTTGPFHSSTWRDT
jgi:hypothetical protein